MHPSTRAELKRLGAALRKARNHLGWSQEDFAEQADIHRTYVGRIERGEVNVSWENISRVARAAGVRVSELIAAAGL